MKDRKFLEEAIADAKTVKDSAIANAKAAIEESFTPHLKSIFSAKIEEMENEEENEEMMSDEATETSENIHDSEPMEDDQSTMDEIDIDELLAELSKMDGEEESIDEAKEEDGEEKAEEEAEEAVEDEDKESTEEDEFNLEDISEDELKGFIEDVINDMVNSGELEAGPGAEGSEEMGSEDMGSEDMGAEEEVNLEEIIQESKNMKETKETQKLKKELKEAYNAINTIQKELNEINLLNAKLLYSNKILKAKSLTENQKMKVLGAFDKVSTVKDAKIVYDTLMESFKTPITKKPITEGIMSGASKTLKTPSSTKTPIVESDEMVKRFQKLAGIK